MWNRLIPCVVVPVMLAVAMGCGDGVAGARGPAEHATASAGAEPQASRAPRAPRPPPAPIHDVAVLAPANMLGLTGEVERFDEPHRLITPSATIAVDGVSRLDALPAAAVDLVTDGATSGSARSYRPADGQSVGAWSVTVGPPPDLAPDAEGDDPAHASTSLSLDAGAQRLTIVAGHTGEGEHADGGGAATFPCRQVPCDPRYRGRYLLVASTSATAAAALSLVATVDGAEQSLDMESGDVTSDVSRVAYSRPSSQPVVSGWAETTHLVRTESQLRDEHGTGMSDMTRGGVRFTYGGTVSRVHLSPFDYRKGWAPAGKAWLVVPIEHDPARASGEWQANLDLARTWTLTVDGTVVPHDDGAGAARAAVFLVDDDFTAGTFTYRPTGSVSFSYPEVSYAFLADVPLVLDVGFPDPAASR